MRIDFLSSKDPGEVQAALLRPVELEFSARMWDVSTAPEAAIPEHMYH